MELLFSFVCGYIVCIIAPVPGLSRKVLDAWAALGTKIKALISSEEAKLESKTTTTTASPTTPATETTSETTEAKS